ncbi:NAD(P)H-quinone oxidoreductase [Dactylosporangium matsuzakiense]|uniref:NAD(P)H quinone oxidoreductase n=1 Tax=Dactylosporangium matsuzakiense TaxID=53360 RepID=A0A9W6NR71_9ACTN|nr:NAD(P)H-quinone oxidoreductase [Dactylosporangium matsuzakiense]UWZ44731.1 NAD(P)H-quinone oxidoreductase [Dactylosporangium matsuzakiense]GLL05981.1 NAD(P)H quinone oxidoreductase [Dactylosporangium matsuzakiense]
MHAITIERPGGPEVLRWTEVADPAPGDGEVLIEVAAAGVNRADALQRQGNYPPPKDAPPYPGLEVSGRVRELGPGVHGWHVGQEVCALLGGGGYAELVVAPAAQVLPVPQKVDLVDAAGLPEVAATVFSNLVDLARLKPGETLLVHGGGSGIGTFAVQLGKALGAEVVVTARAAKHERLLKLGADRAIDYTSVDFAKEVQADVVLDIMGGPYLKQNVDVLKVGGRLVVIGLQGGRRGELDMGQLLTKRALVAGTTLRGRSAAEKAAIVRGVREEVWPLLDEGMIRPVIDSRTPVTEAAEAHRLLESNEHFGKVLLTVG